MTLLGAMKEKRKNEGKISWKKKVFARERKFQEGEKVYRKIKVKAKTKMKKNRRKRKKIPYT